MLAGDTTHIVVVVVLVWGGGLVHAFQNKMFHHSNLSRPEGRVISFLLIVLYLLYFRSWEAKIVICSTTSKY